MKERERERERGRERMCKRKEVRGVEGRIDDRMTSEPINLYKYKCR